MLLVNQIRLHESPDQHEIALKLITSFITGDCIAWREILAPGEMFLTEIVSNKYCNIDVDKCDYLLRDAHYLSEHVTVKPFLDFLTRARIVYDSSGISHIGYHKDDFELIENLFYNRAYFHMNIYQHHRVVAVEKMVRDICVKGDSAGRVSISGLGLLEAHQNNNAYTQLDDSVLDLIENSLIQNEAQEVLTDLYENRHYSLVWETRENDAKKVFEQLSDMFGSIFCLVGKFIPAAEVPLNIPLYNDALEPVQLTSSLKLSYKSEMIFCTSPNKVIVTNVINHINSLMNNNV